MTIGVSQSTIEVDRPPIAAQAEPVDEYTDSDDYEPCWQCNGQGWGIVGVDWDSDDPINGPYDGEFERCPCCGGSGDGKDCTYW